MRPDEQNIFIVGICFVELGDINDAQEHVQIVISRITTWTTDEFKCLFVCVLSVYFLYISIRLELWPWSLMD